MPEYRQVGQEVWIRETVQCINSPSTYIVLQGSDTRFYPALFIEENSIEVHFLDGKLTSFEHYEDALAFLSSLAKL